MRADADRAGSQEILFYEASEGGAGVLRQLVEDPAVLPLLARRALEICHFDPDTLEDEARRRCGKACYDCLLDYGNQPDHKVLDRHLIRDLLARTVAVPSAGPPAAPGRGPNAWPALRKRCDSQLEKRWLDLVDDLMLRPPSDGQYLIEACSTQPGLLLPRAQRRGLHRRPASRCTGRRSARTRTSRSA